MNKYRSLYPIMRNIIAGPVQGEGGNQLFYQGYVDDIEARLIDPETSFNGIKFPLLIDFDLIKQRGKSFVHGVGYYPIFFHTDSPITATKQQVLTYIATEIAYGHGGYIPDPGTSYNIVEHAKIEYDHVYKIQQLLVNATPVSIQYGNSLQTASDYIKTHPGYADISNYADFMGKVKITYSNGTIVFVNRHPSETWNVTVGSPNKWYSYHALVNGVEQLFAGQSSNTSFVLPVNNGWVVYNPGFSTTIKGPLAIEHPDKGQAPITYNWTASTVQGTPPYTYKWYWNNVLVSTSSTYSRTLSYDGWYNPRTHILQVDILDSATPKLKTSASKTITEYCGGYHLNKMAAGDDNIPTEFMITQNYPNPFNPVTIIRYGLPEDTKVQLKVYDILGKEVAELVNEDKSAGYYEVEFNGSNLPAARQGLSSGVYFYRIQAGSFVDAKKMILMK